MLWMPKTLRAALLALIVGVTPTLALAQNAQITFGGLQQDTSLPVEIEADQLAVNQVDGSATFTGNVLLGQGTMRLTAGALRVEYAQGTTSIARLFATGGVTLTNGGEAAEADEAVYTIDDATVVMTGNVLLTQGSAALSGQKLVVDLKTGNGVMEGRVKSTFLPGVKK